MSQVKLAFAVPTFWTITMPRANPEKGTMVPWLVPGTGSIDSSERPAYCKTRVTCQAPDGSKPIETWAWSLLHVAWSTRYCAPKTPTDIECCSPTGYVVAMLSGTRDCESQPTAGDQCRPSSREQANS